MIEDQKKFLTLKEEKGGNVSFGDNGSERIAGRGTVSLDNGRAKAKNVLYVEGLKHNLMCQPDVRSRLGSQFLC